MAFATKRTRAICIFQDGYPAAALPQSRWRGGVVCDPSQWRLSPRPRNFSARFVVRDGTVYAQIVRKGGLLLIVD